MALDPFGSSEGLDPTQPVAGLDPFAPDPNAPGPLKKGFGVGVAGVKASVAGAGALAARAVGAPQLEAAALAKVKEQEEIAALDARRVEDVDWTSPGAIADHFKYLLGQAVPSLALMFTGGVLGRGAGAIARRVGAGAAAPNVGMIAGAAAPNVAVEAGSIYPAALETGVEDPALRALGGGVLAAATDFVPLLAAGRYIGAAGKVGGLGAMAKKAAVGAPVGAVLEGSQELTQTLIERAAAGQDLTGPEAISDYINSFAGGAAPGAVFGAGVGALRGRKAPAEPQPIVQPTVQPAVVSPAAPVSPRVETPLSPEDAADLEFANLVTAHDAAAARATALEQALSEAQAIPKAAEARLAELKAEEAKPLGERRPKSEIITERKALQKQARDSKAGLETIGGELNRLRKSMGELAPRIAAHEERAAARTALANTPTGLNPAIQEREPAPASSTIETEPRVDESQVDRAVKGVHALFREQGMPLTTTRESFETPVQGRREVALARAAEQNAPRETVRGPSKAQMQAVEPHAMAVIEPMARQLAEAKTQTPEGRAKVAAKLTAAMRTVVQEAAKQPDVTTAMGYITAKLPAALKGQGVAKDAEDIAKAVAAAVSQAQTQYSRGAVTRKPLQVVKDDSGTRNSYTAFFDENDEASLTFIPRRGKSPARLLAIRAAETQGVRGREMVAWLAQTHGPAIVEDVLPQAQGFWERMQAEGLIHSWEPISFNSSAALTQDEFDALPPRDQPRVIDEYNRIMARKGRELREHLRQLIGDDPNLVVTTFQAKPGDPIGSYTRVGAYKSLISLALNAKQELSVADHEGYHYAEDQLLDARERAVVANALRPGKPLFEKLMERVRRYDVENQTKLADEVAATPAEARAYAFEFWRRGELQTEGLVNRVFEKIAAVLRAIQRFVTGQGYQSIEDIFTALDRGQFAQRQRAILAGDRYVGTDVSASRAADQTKTEAFKKWFGDSKVVDKDGRPLVVYHGTTGRHNEFSADNRGKNFRNPVSAFGTFFTADKDVAYEFGQFAADKAWRASEGRTNPHGRVIAAYLSIQSPADIDATGWSGRSQELVAALRVAVASGADGAIIRNWEDGSGTSVQYIAFSSEQIKSATGNIGTFDPNNPDIRYSDDASGTWYRSALTDQVSALPMKSGSAKAWQEHIKGLVAKGAVKQAEIDAVGLAEMLQWKRDQEVALGVPHKIRRDEVVSFLREHGVQVEEVVLGNDGDQEFDGELRVQRTIDGRWGVADQDGEVFGGTYATEAEAYTALNERQDKEMLAPRYDDPDYQLPGGSEYRELLLRLPTGEKPFTLPSGWRVEAFPPEAHIPHGWRIERNPAVTYETPMAPAWRVVNAEGVQHSVGDTPQHAVAAGGFGIDAEINYQVLDAEGTQRGIGATAEEAIRDAGTVVHSDGRTKSMGEIAGQVKFTAPHYGEYGKNLLAHVRLTMRTDAEGKKVLFLEEIQSDWGQAGQKQGFAGQKSRLPANIVVRQSPVPGHGFAVIVSGAEYSFGYDTETAALDAAFQVAGITPNERMGRAGVPEAPFVTKTEAWVALVLKRMIRYAVENGADRIAWTTGDQQVQRYANALQKKVDAIEWTKTPGGVHLVGWKGGGTTSAGTVPDDVRVAARTAIRRNDNLGFETWSEAIEAVLSHPRDWSTRWGDIDDDAYSAIQQYVEAYTEPVISRTKVVDTTQSENELSDAIGKAMADRIRNDPAQTGTISGENITINKAWPVKFYERIVPQVANEVLRKLGGGKVGRVSVATNGEGELVRSYTGPERTVSDITNILRTNKRAPSTEQFGVQIERQLEAIRSDIAMGATSFAAAVERHGSIAAAEILGGRITDSVPGLLDQPGFDITPALVQRALQGLPLFSRAAAEYTTPHASLPAYGRTKSGSVSVPAVHFSPTEGLTRLDSARYGTGLKGAEAARVAAGDPRLKQRVHFYVPQGYGVQNEAGTGEHAYGVHLSNLYDAEADPQRLWANGGELAVLEAGYDGYLARGSSTAVLLGRHSVPVASLGIGAKEASARLGSASVPPLVLDQNRLLAEDLIRDKRLPGGQLRPAEWKETIAKVAPDLAARLPASIYEGTAPVYRDQLIGAFYRNAPVDFTNDGLGRVLNPLSATARTHYSRGAVAAEEQQSRQMAAGELQQAQLFQTAAKMIEDARTAGPDSLMKTALGGLGTEVSGGIARWWQKNIATPNFTSRMSAGYRNVFKTLNTYVRYRNDLVERMLIQRIPLWYTANVEDQDAAFTALNKRNVNGYSADSQELRDIMAGLNERQRAMFVQASQMFEGYLRQELEADKPFYRKVYRSPGAYEKWLTERTDQVTTMIDKGYMPLRRYGDHTVHVYMDTVAEDGRPVKLSGALEFFGTARGAHNAAKIYEEEIKRSGAQLKVEVGTHYKAARDTTISAQQFLDTARRNGVPLTAMEQERLVKALTSADSLTRNRMLHREGMPGYSKDGMRVLNEFGMRMSGKLAYAKFASAIDAATAGRAVESDVIGGVAQIQIDQDRGPNESVQDFQARNLWKREGPMSGFHRNLADELTDYVLVPDHTGEWSRKLRGAAMMYFIGGSLSAGVVNTMSVPMMVVPELSIHTNYANAAATALSAWTTTWRYQHILRDVERLKSNAPEDAIPGIDAGLRGALVEAAQYTMDTELHQIMGISQGQLFSQSQGVQRAMKAWMAPFRISEQTNRITAFIAAYKLASTGEGVRQADGSYKRLSGPELFRFARDMIDSTQNNYNETNRPGAARNPIYALMFMFKSFPLFITEAIALMYKANPRSAVYMLLGLVAMTGVQGLPFAETIEDLIDTIAQRIFGSPFNTRRAMRNVIKQASEALTGYDASELVLRGVINHVLGVSASSRIGAGDFIPGTRLGTADADAGRTLGDLLGAPFAMVKDTTSNVIKAAGGALSGDWKQLADALRAGGPVAVRNAIKGAEQLAAGYTTDAKGRRGVDVNGLEAVLQMAGLSSASLAKGYEFESINRQTKAFHAQVSADMQNQLVKALRDGDTEKVQEINNLRSKWNEQYPSMPILANPVAVRRDLALSGLPMDRRSVLLWSRRLRGENIFSEQAQ